MSDLVRLNINLNRPTADALEQLAATAGSATEAVRRAISIYKFLTDEVKAGRQIQTMDKDGRNAREVVFL